MKKKKKKEPIVCSTGEVVETYRKYLKTKHWEALRIKVAEFNNYTCYGCKEIFLKGFHIHHWHYKTIGNEKMTDVAFLCADCHAKIHNRNPKETKKPTKKTKIRFKNEKQLKQEKLDKMRSIAVKRIKKMDEKDVSKVLELLMDIEKKKDFANQVLALMKGGK